MGSKDGYDISLTRRIAESVNIPVIASGGAGDAEHMRRALADGKADAVLAASSNSTMGVYVGQVKEYLLRAGIPVRI